MPRFERYSLAIVKISMCWRYIGLGDSNMIVDLCIEYGDSEVLMNREAELLFHELANLSPAHRENYFLGTARTA